MAVQGIWIVLSAWGKGERGRKSELSVDGKRQSTSGEKTDLCGKKTEGEKETGHPAKGLRRPYMYV